MAAGIIVGKLCFQRCPSVNRLGYPLVKFLFQFWGVANSPVTGLVQVLFGGGAGQDRGYSRRQDSGYSPQTGLGLLSPDRARGMPSDRTDYTAGVTPFLSWK